MVVRQFALWVRQFALLIIMVVICEDRFKSSNQDRSTDLTSWSRVYMPLNYCIQNRRQHASSNRASSNYKILGSSALDSRRGMKGHATAVFTPSTMFCFPKD